GWITLWYARSLHDALPILIDYKGSAAELTSWKSWLENRQVQMPLYALLLEGGFSELPPGEVVAANFYVVRDRDRGRGYFVKEDRSEEHTSELQSRENLVCR